MEVAKQMDAEAVQSEDLYRRKLSGMQKRHRDKDWPLRVHMYGLTPALDVSNTPPSLGVNRMQDWKNR